MEAQILAVDLTRGQRSLATEALAEGRPDFGQFYLVERLAEVVAEAPLPFGQKSGPYIIGSVLA